MGKYLDIIRAAERQKAQRGAFVVSGVSVVIRNDVSVDQRNQIHPTKEPYKDPPQANWLYDQNDRNDKRGVAPPFPFADALDHLDRRCPDHIEAKRWQQCVVDASRFIASWGDKALALGWTADELFGLPEPPARPHPSYSRLSRYDCTGLLWLLQGRRVIALTNTTAAISTSSGIVTYRKLRKPAYGPLGDSLDDFSGDGPEAA